MKESEYREDEYAQPELNPIPPEEELHENHAVVDEAKQRADLLKAAQMWELVKNSKAAEGKKTEAYYYAWHMELMTKKQLGQDIPVPEELQAYRTKNQLKGQGASAGVSASQEPTPADKAYEVRSFNRVDLKKNADDIARLYALLDSKDHWYKGGSSPQFRALMGELKNLKELASKMEKNRANSLQETDPEKAGKLRKQEKETMLSYLRSAEEFDRLTQVYLDGKKGKTDTTYAKERFAAVTEVRRICAINRASVERTYQLTEQRRFEIKTAPRQAAAYVKAEKEKYANWLNNVYNKYDLGPGAKENRKAFYGDRYTDQSLFKLPHPYGISVARTAGHSITTIALMAMKDEKGNYLYTEEDIMDPAKLQKEKADLFHKLVLKTSEKKPENAKWLAETMHKGYMASIDRIGKMLGKVDYSDPDYIFSPEFSRAGMLGFTLMDVWQEMGRMPEDMFKAGKKDFPDLKTPQDYLDKVGSMRGYLDQFAVNIQRVAEGLRDLDFSFSDLAQKTVFFNSFTVNHLRSMFAKKAVACKDKPFADWFTYDEGAIGRGLYLGVIDNMSSVEFSSKQVFEQKLSSILDGTAFANITYTYDPKAKNKFVLHGTLDGGLMTDDYELSKMSETQILKQVNTQLDAFEQLKKTSGPVMQTYISGAITGVSTLSMQYASYTKMNEEQKKQAADAVRDIFAFRLASIFRSVGAKEEELKELVDKNLPKVPAYRKFLDNVGVGSLKALMMGDVTEQIEKCDDVYLDKCRLVKRNLENGVYKDEVTIETAYAMAYTVTLIDQVGKLPEKNNRAGDAYKPGEYVNDYLKSWRKQKNQKDQLAHLRKYPETVKEMLSDTKSMKEYVEKTDKKIRDWRKSEDEKERRIQQEREKTYQKRQAERARKKEALNAPKQGDVKEEPKKEEPKKEQPKEKTKPEGQVKEENEQPSGQKTETKGIKKTGPKPK